MQRATTSENKQEQTSDNIPFAGIATVRKLNIAGRNFFPLPDNETIAFIQDNKDSIVTLWNISDNSVFELNHKQSLDDKLYVNDLTASNDGRYLIAVTRPNADPNENFELVIWDLLNKTKEPLQRISTKINDSYQRCVATENNMLIIHFTNRRSAKWQSKIATFAIANNGTLQATKQFDLDNTFHVALSSKGLVFSMSESNNSIGVLNSNGEPVLNGGLDLNSLQIPKGVILYDVFMVNNTTLAIKETNESLYYVDISLPEQPKQIGYVNSALLNRQRNQSTYPRPMSIETGLVAIQLEDTLFFVKLNDNKVVKYTSGCDQWDFHIALLSNRYLISSVCEKNQDKKLYSIAINKIDILESLEETYQLANEVLCHTANFPREIAPIVGDYLLGSRIFTTVSTNKDDKPAQDQSIASYKWTTRSATLWKKEVKKDLAETNQPRLLTQIPNKR